MQDHKRLEVLARVVDTRIHLDGGRYQAVALDDKGAAVESGRRFVKRDRAEREAEVFLSAGRSSRQTLATRAIVATNKCPDCGRALRENKSISGWYQCSQYGSVGWRVDASAKPCGWQGFI